MEGHIAIDSSDGLKSRLKSPDTNWRRMDSILFDLESVAHRMTHNLLKDDQLDTDQRAKVEYGLSLVLGMATELILTVGASFLMGTAIYTLLIMLAALALRIFTGGAHCSSFRRCQVFTLLIFIGFSLIVKAAVMNIEFKGLMWISLLLVLISLPLIWKPKRFTLAIWMICAALPIWGLLSLSGASWLMIFTLSIEAGLVLQAFMVNTVGQKLVRRSDQIMQRLGI